MDGILEAILNAILPPVLEFLGRCLLYLLVYVIGIPALCLFLTPVVLINACFGGTTYWSNVVSGYEALVMSCLSFAP